MAQYVYRCRVCALTHEVHSDTIVLMGEPSHCEVPMKRDYRAESATATFKGGGWARSGK